MVTRLQYYANRRKAEWDRYFGGLNRDEFELVIEGLSPIAQTILRMRHLEGKQYKEIAPIVGYSPNGAWAIVQRALRALEIKISD